MKLQCLCDETLMHFHLTVFARTLIDQQKQWCIAQSQSCNRSLLNFKFLLYLSSTLTEDLLLYCVFCYSEDAIGSLWHAWGRTSKYLKTGVCLTFECTAGVVQQQQVRQRWGTKSSQQVPFCATTVANFSQACKTGFSGCKEYKRQSETNLPHVNRNNSQMVW